MDPHLIVVFDTNAYISIGRAELDDIIASETSAGVMALVSVWSCLELLSRIASPNARKGDRALAALKKISAHAGYTSSDGPRIRVHEAGEFTLVRGLFGQEPDEPLLEIGFVADLVVAASHMPPDEFRAEHASELARIAERVAAEERRIGGFPAASSAISAGSRRAPPGPTPLSLGIIAAGLVQVLAEQYGVELDPVNSQRAVTLLTQNFPVALAFVYHLIADVSQESGVPGGVNSAWDLKIAFHAARGAAIQGLPVVLVTDDGRLHRAAFETGDELRVVKLSNYRSLISDTAAIAERAEQLGRRR
jgi:hypothetical protein